MSSMPILIALLFAAVPLPLAAGDHAKAHESHQAPAPTPAEDPVPAMRWQADVPLSQGMRRIRVATQALAHDEHGHLDAAQRQALAAELGAAVRDIFAHCRLAPEPDAALHPLLARVLVASKALGQGRNQAAAVAELQAVLQRYPQLFEDTDWDSPVPTEPPAGDQ